MAPVESQCLYTVIRFRKGVVSKRLIATVFEGTGPLSTFSSKISLCRALGLFGEEVRHDLQILRKIRNDFAHSPQQLHLSDFSQCNNLIVVSDVNFKDEAHERRRFKHSCAGIVGAVCLGVAISIAEAKVLYAHRDEVVALAGESLSGVRTTGGVHRK